MSSRLGRYSTLPPVGVVAATQNLAASIARELNMTNAIPLGLHSLTATRGQTLNALLVDESVWPLTEDQKEALLPCLAETKGYVLQLNRHDFSVEQSVEQSA